MADNISTDTVEIPNRWSIKNGRELYLYIKCKDLIINYVDYSGEYKVLYYLPYYPVKDPYMMISSVDLFQRELTDSAASKLTAYLRQVLPPVDLPTLFAQLEISHNHRLEFLQEQLEREIKNEESELATLKESLTQNWSNI
jgi:hypothetical protein